MYKCRVCGDKFNEIEDLYGHLEDDHQDAMPKNFSASQYYYYLKTGREHGNCVVCKRETTWNESTKKYHRFCERPVCKETYKKEFRERMIGKHGRVHLLNDPDQQKKMLANRSISGTYKWSDGKEIGYTGTYEKDFLRFLDIIMEFDSEDIMSPSPHTYYYIYEGEEKFYIPDFFIPSLNLEIEIKDGGSNPNNHHKIQGVDKVKEKLKDAVLTSQTEFSYIKITDKKYDAFFQILIDFKEDFQENGERTKPIFLLTESFIPEVVTESIGDISLTEINNKKKYGTYNPTPEQIEEYKRTHGEDEPVQEGLVAQTQIVLTYVTSLITGRVHRDKLEEAMKMIDKELATLEHAKDSISLAFKVQLKRIRGQLKAKLRKGDLFPA